MDKSTKSTAGPNCKKAGGSSSSARRRRTRRRKSSTRRRKSSTRRRGSSLIGTNSTSDSMQWMHKQARELSKLAAELAELIEASADPTTEECKTLNDGPQKRICLRREKVRKSSADSSVNLADCEDVEKKKIISLKMVTKDAVSFTGHSYIQYSTDQLRSPGDHLILVPNGTQIKDMDKATLRKVLIPPINPLARRTDTVGFLAVVVNPNIPPDALRRADLARVPLGSHKLVYVRELVRNPQHRYIESEPFEVVQSAPTQPGMVKGTGGEGKLELSWSAPLFDGGEAYKYELELCEMAGGGCAEGAWRTAVIDAEESKATVTPSKYVPASCFDASKRCMWRAKAANSHGQSMAGWASVELPAKAAMSALSLNTDDEALARADAPATACR